MIKTFITAESAAKYLKRTNTRRVVLGLGEDPVTVKDLQFSDLQFSANGSMTWTVQAGDFIFMTYMQIGTKIAMLWFRLQGTTIGGTPNTDLTITLPSYVPLARAAGSINVNRCVIAASGTVSEFCTASIGGGSRSLNIHRGQAGGNNWGLSSDAQTFEGFVSWPLA